MKNHASYTNTFPAIPGASYNHNFHAWTRSRARLRRLVTLCWRSANRAERQLNALRGAGAMSMESEAAEHRERTVALGYAQTAQDMFALLKDACEERRQVVGELAFHLEQRERWSRWSSCKPWQS